MSTAYDSVRKRHLVVFGRANTGGLFGQFVDANGTLVGASSLLIDTDYRVAPVVSYDNVNNLFFVAWLERSQLYGQLLSVDGVPLGERLLILFFGDAGKPWIAANTNAGGFLVTWATYRGRGAQLIGIEH